MRCATRWTRRNGGGGNGTLRGFTPGPGNFDTIWRGGTDVHFAIFDSRRSGAGGCRAECDGRCGGDGAPSTRVGPAGIRAVRALYLAAGAWQSWHVVYSADRCDDIAAEP